MLKIDIMTLFPRMFDSVLSESILKRAQAKGKVEIRLHDIRTYTRDKHRTCDDRPFGGGPGMVLKPEPIDRLAREILKGKKRQSYRFVYVTPQGRLFSHRLASRLSRGRHLVILCGHYEGVDERIRKSWVTDEISIGDYVLTGGEIPAMVIVDAVVRLVPGVLGNRDSKKFESFSEDLLEYPHYTRPQIFRGISVPRVLLSGNHEAISNWRRREALKRTLARRPGLLGKR